MPTPAIIAVTPGSGINLDAVSLTVGLNTVVRETMVIADPSNATYLATVNSLGALNVSDSIIEACVTANVLAVSLPSAQITTLTPPTAAAIGTAVAGDLLIGTQVAGSSVPVALPTATITALTPPTASAIAAAIVADPPAVFITPAPLTASAPTAASVGVTSASAVAANSSRLGIVLTNTSANYISLGFGSAAVLYSGVTLNPNGGVFVMDAFTFNQSAVFAIASGASSNLAIQELT